MPFFEGLFLTSCVPSQSLPTTSFPRPPIAARPFACLAGLDRNPYSCVVSADGRKASPSSPVRIDLVGLALRFLAGLAFFFDGASAARTAEDVTVRFVWCALLWIVSRSDAGARLGEFRLSDESVLSDAFLTGDARCDVLFTGEAIVLVAVRR